MDAADSANGEVLDEAIDERIVRRDAGQDGEPTPPVARPLVALQRQDLPHHRPCLRLAAPRQSADGHRGQALVVETAVAGVGRLALHPANGAGQGRHAGGVHQERGLGNRADEQDVARTGMRGTACAACRGVSWYPPRGSRGR